LLSKGPERGPMGWRRVNRKLGAKKLLPFVQSKNRSALFVKKWLKDVLKRKVKGKNSTL